MGMQRQPPYPLKRWCVSESLEGLAEPGGVIKVVVDTRTLPWVKFTMVLTDELIAICERCGCQAKWKPFPPEVPRMQRVLDQLLAAHRDCEVKSARS